MDFLTHIILHAGKEGIKAIGRKLKEKSEKNSSSSSNYYTSSSYTNGRIAKKVRAIIVEKLGVDEEELNDSASFVNDLGADSLDAFELMMDIEKQFGISIPDEDLEKIVTVGDAIAYVEQHV